LLLCERLDAKERDIARDIIWQEAFRDTEEVDEEEKQKFGR